MLPLDFPCRPWYRPPPWAGLGTSPWRNGPHRAPGPPDGPGFSAARPPTLSNFLCRYGLVVGTNAVVFGQRQQIVEAAARQRIPAIYARREYVDAGGLMSYGTDLSAHYSHAADYVHRILQGAKPGDLPIEQPSKFELVVNMKTAKALGIKIPQSILVRATTVIE